MSSNLDVLRAFAVLCVLASHILMMVRPEAKASISPLGLTGVLLFFVHTSLVLMQSLERHGRQPNWAARFYLRRFFRIYPLAVAVLSCTLLLEIPGDPNCRYSTHPIYEVAANYLLVQNFLPKVSILRPMWSLPYEIQMYLLLPPIFFLLWRPRWRVISLATLIMASLALARLNYTWPKDLEVFMYLPCFMGGVLAFQLRRMKKPILPAACWPWVLLLWCASFLVASSLRGDVRLLWLFCLSFGSLVPLFRDLRASAFTRAAKQIAEYSYSIYLLHDPLLWVCFKWTPLSLPWKITAFTISLPLACLFFYHAIEKPMIHLGVKLTEGKRNAHANESRKLPLTIQQMTA